MRASRPTPFEEGAFFSFLDCVCLLSCVCCCFRGSRATCVRMYPGLARRETRAARIRTRKGIRKPPRLRRLRPPAPSPLPVSSSPSPIYVGTYPGCLSPPTVTRTHTHPTTAPLHALRCSVPFDEDLSCVACASLHVFVHVCVYVCACVPSSSLLPFA